MCLASLTLTTDSVLTHPQHTSEQESFEFIEESKKVAKPLSVMILKVIVRECLETFNLIPFHFSNMFLLLLVVE